MKFRYIKYDVDDTGVATITYNRPHRLNAMTRPMCKEIIAVMDEVDGDDRVRAAIFTGTGRAFCAGADMGDGTQIFERSENTVFDMEVDADYGGYASRRFFESLKPLIAAINGPAVGVGISTTLPMDIRIASTSARFGFVFARRGIVPESAASWFLPRLVGISRAAEWVYSGRVFGPDEALDCGLVRSVHEPEDLMAAAHTLALELTTSSSAVAVAVSRRMLWQMYGAGTPETAHKLDSRGVHSLGRSADCAEGVTAFLEKRPARFPMKPSTDLPEYFRRWQEAGSAETFIAEDEASPVATEGDSPTLSS